jgi:hypothetical protein
MAIRVSSLGQQGIAGRADLLAASEGPDDGHGCDDAQGHKGNDDDHAFEVRDGAAKAGSLGGKGDQVVVHGG